MLQAGEGPDPAGSTATLVITLQPGDGYVVGEPSTLTVTIVHTDERCDRPTFAAVPTNSAQTIAVGQVPVPLQLVDPVNGEAFAALISGQLPPGVGLARDGSFTGAATTAGTFVATVGSCRPVFGPPPGHCSSTTLTVRVTGTSVADRVPPCSVRATGATSSAGEPFAFDAAGATLAFLGDLPGAPGAALVHRVATGSTTRCRTSSAPRRPSPP